MNLNGIILLKRDEKFNEHTTPTASTNR